MKNKVHPTNKKHKFYPTNKKNKVHPTNRENKVQTTNMKKYEENIMIFPLFAILFILFAL